MDGETLRRGRCVITLLCMALITYGYVYRVMAVQWRKYVYVAEMVCSKEKFVRGDNDRALKDYYCIKATAEKTALSERRTSNLIFYIYYTVEVDRYNIFKKYESKTLPLFYFSR